jgi:hypothetical protein
MSNKKIAVLLGALLACAPLSWAQDRVIDVDVNAVKGKLNQTFNLTVGAGRANEGLRADWQQQLAEIKRDAGFKNIRMHGLLNDDMGVYGGRTRRAMNDTTSSTLTRCSTTCSASMSSPSWNLASCRRQWPAAARPSSGGRAM